MKDISVILFYNQPRKWLKEARDSYYCQHFDGTSELIEVNLPQSTANNLNEGCKRATGKYIKYLCDDDILLPNCLQSLFDKAEQTGADIVCAGAFNFNQETGEHSNYYSKVPDTIIELAEQNTIHGGTTLFKLSAVRAVGYFNTDLQYGEEYDMYLKLAANGYSFAELDDLVYFYRMHNEMKSMQTKVTDGETYIKRKRSILNDIQERYFISGQIKKVI